MSSGADPGESAVHRGRRRVAVGYMFIGAVSRLVYSLVAEPASAVVNVSAALISVGALFVLRARPTWFVGIVNVLLFVQLAEVEADTVVFGGLWPSGMVILFGFVTVIGALMVLDVRAAAAWLVGFLVAVVAAVALSDRIEPVHAKEGSPGETAGTVVGVAIFVFAGMAYFVRQRDQFQRESDNLLYNILPDEIARRLKGERAMIADDYESASVLFADVVDFTPMSAAMSPPQLVGLLNSAFTTFDGFVEELGLEKIKTVGDAYMVASGVPVARWDHAHAIAELALRIRDHTETINSTAIRSKCASASTRGRLSPGSSGHTSSPTTCGAMSSIPQVAWSQGACPARSR